MKRALPRMALVPLSILVICCSTVPITGRRQFTIIPESQMMAMADQQYAEFMKANPRSANQAQVRMVRNVGERLRAAVERYMAEQDRSSDLKNFAWEFNLVESKDVNAWAMPGGKIVFYTGILPLTRDETGIAVVMGHEIAHVIARHGNERMTQALVAQMGGMALAQALKDRPEQTQKLWLGAFGLGAQVGILLPYSRLHEKEADRLGMIFMAMAGYNPEAAVEFWGRMAEMNKGGVMPEFLSTHPSDATRIRLLKELLPEAKGYYRP